MRKVFIIENAEKYENILNQIDEKDIQSYPDPFEAFFKEEIDFRIRELFPDLIGYESLEVKEELIDQYIEETLNSSYYDGLIDFDYLDGKIEESIKRVNKSENKK